MADGEVVFNVEGEMVTISQGAKSSGDPIVPGKTPSTNDTGDNSTAISTVTSDYSESTTLLHDEPKVVYQDLQKFSKKRPQAPPPSSDKVVYTDILHFPSKTEQHPPFYDDIEPSIPSVTIIPANVQDDDIPPPIPANVQDDDIPPPIPANVQDDDIPPPIPANVQDDDIPPPIPVNVQDDDIPPPIPAKTNKTSDTNKQASDDEEITGRLTSPSVNISEVEPIQVQFGNNDAQSGKPTVDDTVLSYQSIGVEEGSNNNQSSSEIVPPQVTSVPLTIPNKSIPINNPCDKTNQSVSDEKDPSTI